MDVFGQLTFGNLLYRPAAKINYNQVTDNNLKDLNFFHDTEFKELINCLLDGKVSLLSLVSVFIH